MNLSRLKNRYIPWFLIVGLFLHIYWSILVMPSFLDNEISSDTWWNPNRSEIGEWADWTSDEDVIVEPPDDTDDLSFSVEKKPVNWVTIISLVLLICFVMTFVFLLYAIIKRSRKTVIITVILMIVLIISYPILAMTNLVTIFFLVFGYLDLNNTDRTEYLDVIRSRDLKLFCGYYSFTVMYTLSFYARFRAVNSAMETVEYYDEYFYSMRPFVAISLLIFSALWGLVVFYKLKKSIGTKSIKIVAITLLTFVLWSVPDLIRDLGTIIFYNYDIKAVYDNSNEF